LCIVLYYSQYLLSDTVHPTISDMDDLLSLNGFENQ